MGFAKEKIEHFAKLKQKEANYTLEHEEPGLRQNIDFQPQKVGGQRIGFAHKD